MLSFALVFWESRNLLSLEMPLSSYLKATWLEYYLVSGANGSAATIRGGMSFYCPTILCVPCTVLLFIVLLYIMQLSQIVVSKLYLDIYILEQVVKQTFKSSKRSHSCLCLSWKRVISQSPEILLQGQREVVVYLCFILSANI